MSPLESFIREHRSRMVAYAARLLTRRFGPACAADMAEDVVQETCLFILENDRNTEAAWTDSLFVGKVRFNALRAGEVAGRVVEVRNTAGDARPVRHGPSAPADKRRSRTTNFYPTQVLGRSLATAFDLAHPADKEKDR